MTARFELPGHVAQVRLPVAVAPEERQADAAAVELGPQRGQQLPALVVDRAPAAEQEVVLAHLGQPLAGNAAAPGDVLQERHHVLGTFGPTEGQQQHRVVGIEIRPVGGGALASRTLRSCG